MFSENHGPGKMNATISYKTYNVYGDFQSEL